VAERVLRAQGFGVVTAAHGGHALLACLTGTRFDVLVTELSMPDMTGPELAERVRRYFSDIPVVYIAGSGTAAREGVLVRPFTRDVLVAEIELALAATLA
jgi:CheY-like chemotaxis protein